MSERAGDLERGVVEVNVRRKLLGAVMLEVLARRRANMLIDCCLLSSIVD